MWPHVSSDYPKLSDTNAVKTSKRLPVERPTFVPSCWTFGRFLLRWSVMSRYHIIPTAWGPFAAVFGSSGLAGTVLPGNKSSRTVERIIGERWPTAAPTRTGRARFRRAVQAYFVGKPAVFDMTLDLGGMSEFTQMVLEACRLIPYGQTAGYADLARAVGAPGAARAVGSVMARNPMPLIVPCHRVVRSDGALGGFSSPEGVVLKRRLLQLEDAL